MSASSEIIKSLKTNGLDDINMIPLSLRKHMSPQIGELFATPWFQTALEYFTQPPQIHITSVDTKEVELLNILGELRDYLANLADSPSTATLGSPKDLQKIRSILEKINPKKITRTQRRALRKYIEITPTGREILKGFYTTVTDSGRVAQDMELIFNPYTSLVNLAEIYSQCTEYSRVRYSVPELGLVDAEIHLYYPAAKRNKYLAQQQDGKQPAWLPDALRRICFFNRLLNTKKQPRAIHVFLADFCKEFMHVEGKADLIFTPSEINTGVCDMTDIIITRSEESLKTLLHELIHFHSLDFKHAAHDEFCAGLFNITTEQSSFNLFEAHTECLASILHCITRTVTSGLKFQQKFKQVFTAQIYYTMRKAAQILATSGCDSYAEFITPSDSSKCKLHENTNVFSYFFVKSFIYLGLRDWIAGCCDKRTARFLDTSGPTGGQHILKNIIHAGYQNRILQKIIDKEIGMTQQPNNYSGSATNAANNSLKMLCIT
jgi:hypothetical protein